MKYFESKIYSEKQLYAYKNLSAHLERLAGSIGEDTTVFLGSSTIQGLPVGQVTFSAMNLGIGGEKLLPLANRVGQYKQLSQAKAMVVMAGFNDICEGADVTMTRFRLFAKSLPENLPMVVSSLQPTVNKSLCADLGKKIKSYNKKIDAYCQQRLHCIFVNISEYMQYGDNNPEELEKYFEKDGIHFNPRGYQLLVIALRQALNNLLNKQEHIES